ncbi:unnamed protein product, partial [Nesidiocoris tenuis]
MVQKTGRRSFSRGERGQVRQGRPLFYYDNVNERHIGPLEVIRSQWSAGVKLPLQIITSRVWVSQSLRISGKGAT